MWKSLGKIALEQNIIHIAIRCFSAIGDIPKVRYLQKVQWHQIVYEETFQFIRQYIYKISYTKLHFLNIFRSIKLIKLVRNRYYIFNYINADCAVVAVRDYQWNGKDEMFECLS